LLIARDSQHLAANVFNYLTKRYPQEVQGTSQLSVASHFFNSNKSALRNLRHALQALAFRIAQYDTVYANHFEKSCNSFQQLQQVDDIWEKAFKGFFCSPEYNSRAYVVIDGSDQLTPDDRKLLIRILKDISPTKPQLGDPRFRLQVLICEKRSKDSPIESHLGKDTPILHLDGEINKLDLRAFVTAKVDTHLTWRRWHIRDEIIDAVVSRANGRFDSVDLQIKDLQSKKGKLGVQRALQQPAQDIPAAIRDELQRLSQDLDEVELEEVRKLLTWLIFGRDSYSYNLSNIKDMLAFQQNEDDIEDGSVEELEVQLRDRYNTLFDVERMDDKTTEDLIKAAEDIDSADQPPIATNTTYHIYNSNPQTTYVKVKNSIEDFFLQDQLPGSEVDEVDEAVRAAQMEIVKRFLNLVCDGEMLKRLGFEKVLEQKQEKPKNAIVVDRRKSKIEILGTTLTIITDPDCWTRYSGAGNPFLSEHAVACFADYLSDVSPDSLNADEGGKIIGMLVRILRDEDSIRRWAHDNRRIADNFLDYAPRTADNVASFCETTSFTDQLDIDDQEWIKSILSPDGKVLRHLLWKPLVDVLSHEWLRNTSWEPDLAYDAIQNFLQYQNPKPEVDGEEKKNNMEAASSTETGQNAAPVGAEGNEVDSRQVPLEGSCGPVENDGVLANKGIEQLPGRQEQGGGPISSNAVENVSDDGSDTSEDLPIWKQVIKAAEWTGFDDDALFHVRVGQTLLIYGENDEAITHFQLAKTDDSQGWRAFQGLGKAYFAKGDKNTDALEAQEKGLAAIARFEDDPKPTEDEHAQLLAEFGETLDATNQHNRAVDAYAQALKLNPRRYDLVKRTVESLNELERYSKIMEIFADLESITTEENDGRTRLVDFFIEKCFQDSLHELAHRAARKTGQKNLIRKLYEDCLQTTSKKGLDEERGIFKLWLARFLLRDCLREDEALEHLNEIVRMTSLVSRSYTTRWTRSFAIRDLANAYLGKARAAGPQSTEAQSFIERLNDLTFAPPVDAEDTDVLYALVGNVSLLLGRWNARWALNDAEARRHLKPNILLGVKLLSDDVPYNDIDAYERLGNAFMAYGDDKNAMAAWSALAPQEPVPTDVADPNDQGSPESLTQVDDPPPTGTTATVASTTQLAASTKGSSVDSSLDIDVEASQKEESLPPEILTLPTNPPPAPGTSETPVPEDDKDDAIAGPEMQAPDASSDMEDSPSSRIHFGCDGECGRSWTTGDDVWHCRDALQLDLCDSCYQLMRKGELGFRVCYQYDEWVNVPKYVGPRLQQDTVRYNGQILKLKDWVDLVKKEWEIT
jgi:tetratricopeptide (TPR) repeat protein